MSGSDDTAMYEQGELQATVSDIETTLTGYYKLTNRLITSNKKMVGQLKKQLLALQRVRTGSEALSEEIKQKELMIKTLQNEIASTTTTLKALAFTANANINQVTATAYDSTDGESGEAASDERSEDNGGALVVSDDNGGGAAASGNPTKRPRGSSLTFRLAL